MLSLSQDNHVQRPIPTPEHGPPSWLEPQSHHSVGFANSTKKAFIEDASIRLRPCSHWLDALKRDKSPKLADAAKCLSSQVNCTKQLGFSVEGAVTVNLGWR